MALEDKNKDSIYQDDPNIYNKETISVPKPERNIGIDTDQKLFDNIVEAGIANKLDISALESFTFVSQSRDQIYALMDMMAEDSTVASALELYTEDVTEYNDNGQIVWCESSDSQVAKYVQFLLDSMNIDKNVYSHIYSLIKYGDLYLRLFKNSDIVQDNLFPKVEKEASKENENKRSLLTESKSEDDSKQVLEEDVKVKVYSVNDHYTHYVEKEPNPAELFELTKVGKSYAYVKADINSVQNQPLGDTVNPNRFRFQFNRNDVTLFEPTIFVHAALEDNSNRTPEEVSLFLNDNAETPPLTYTVRRGQPLLYSLYKIWRLLKLLENSMILNRVTKSSVVRVVGVEVGDMPKEMVGPHLQNIKSMMEQKSAINTGTSISEYTNPGPVENNIYVPTRNQLGSLNIQSIGGDTNVTGLADVDYFKNLFYGALGIPKQYLGDTNDATGFNGGTSLTIISSRYAKRIKRIQNTYCQAITDAINLMLLDAGLESYINKFTIRMQSPTTQEEIDRKDAISSQIQIVRDMMDLLSNFDNNILKLQILTELLTNIITEPEVITLLQEEIEKLKNEGQPEEGNPEDTNIDIDLGVDQEPIEAPQSGDLISDIDNIGTEVESNIEAPSPEETISLPNPEELGIGDLTNNNNQEI